jgi:PAS domain S-box-containing protein
VAELERQITTDEVRQLLDRIPEGGYVNVGGRVSYANQAMANLLGVDDPATLVGRSVVELYHPEDHPAVIERIQAFHATGRQLPPKELRLIRGDGKVRNVETTALRLESVNGDLVILHDFTARKLAEETLRAREQELLEAQRVAGVGSWSLDVVAGKFAFSDETCRICGRRPDAPKPRPGRNEWDGHPMLDAESFDRSLRLFAEVGRSGRSLELELDVMRPDGTTAKVMVRSEPDVDRTGRVIGMHGTILDVTAQKATEQALREASRAKDEFLALLGHELRNPLAPIVTAVKLLKLRGNGQIGKTLEVVERQVQHLVRLVDDLLDVSRITRGQIHIKRQPLLLSNVVAEGIEMAMPLVERRAHHLSVRMEGDDLWVSGDESRLIQVVANLLTNAAKYTDPGGHITVETFREDGELVLRVTDDGIGIAASLLPRVFDLFAQGPQATDRAVGGLGIGLTIVRSRVAMHGGRVEVASDGPGRGSVFTVRLPASVGIPASPLPHARPAANLARHRILIVDDNEDALDLLCEVLRAAGHEVVTATDGPGALNAVKGFDADVAILDIGLPVMDGYELAGRMRAALGERMPFLVALTGYGQDADRARARDAGFAVHLTKPIEPDRLLEAIEDEAPSAG